MKRFNGIHATAAVVFAVIITNTHAGGEQARSDIASGVPLRAQSSISALNTPVPGASPTPLPSEDTSGEYSKPVSDNLRFYQILLDQLEYVHTRDGTGVAWDFQGWGGTDRNRLWVKTEGQRLGGRTDDASVQALWSRPVAAFFDAQGGVRHDFGRGAKRDWIAFGFQGIAPYQFDLEATAFVGQSGRTAARFKAQYALVIAQRTFLTPEFEANAYGKTDRQRGLGSGLSDVSFGLRLRHELRREFAPYIGVSWNRRIGQTAALARIASEPVSELQILAGVRIWF